MRAPLARVVRAAGMKRRRRISSFSFCICLSKEPTINKCSLDSRRRGSRVQVRVVYTVGSRAACWLAGGWWLGGLEFGWSLSPARSLVVPTSHTHQGHGTGRSLPLAYNYHEASSQNRMNGNENEMRYIKRGTRDRPGRQQSVPSNKRQGSGIARL